MIEDDFITILFKRENRNQLLKESDKYLIPDYPITESNLMLVREYRQALRDYMSLEGVVNYSSSCNVPFPDFPQFPF